MGDEAKLPKKSTYRPSMDAEKLPSQDLRKENQRKAKEDWKAHGNNTPEKKSIFRY